LADTKNHENRENKSDHLVECLQNPAKLETSVEDPTLNSTLVRLKTSGLSRVDWVLQYDLRNFSSTQGGEFLSSSARGNFESLEKETQRVRNSCTEKQHPPEKQISP